MTKGLGLREYRACVRCRSRKTRCDLQSTGEPGKPPCVKCIREGANCVLATSRRGGNYSYLRQSKQRSTSSDQPLGPDQDSSHAGVLTHLSEAGANDRHDHDSLQNPSDALLILAHAAGQPENDRFENSDPVINSHSASIYARSRRILRSEGPSNPARTRLNGDSEDINSLYPPLKDGTLTIKLISELLVLYRESYHPYLPIVPSRVLDPGRIAHTLQNESFLLTAILAIASKDVSIANTHKAIWTYLRQKILEIALGAAKTRHISCVEGLLLLGEWTLPAQSSTDEMDSEAPWSILGLAVRLAYRLRLEDSSFHGSDNNEYTDAERRRLAWTFTYLSDRQIPIRMGQAFWCRGPSLSVRFTATDFPSLRPSPSSTEDLASWLQAQIEITTLFGNAHDILFASKSRTVELITRGDYVKYIDDTSRAISAWQQAWHSLTVSKPLRGCLTLMREYLRLYVNAFAFQAVLYRSRGDGQSRQDIQFPYSAMASADARHVYEALDAAESLLGIFVELDPQELRFMPDRFYLYEIHSFVFLFKAHASGAISAARYTETRKLMHRFTTVLTHVSPHDDQHIASRYAKLLARLWVQRLGLDHDAQVGLDEYRAEPDASVGVDGSTDLAGGPHSFVGVDVDGLGSLGGSFDGLEGFGGGFEGLDFLGIPPVFPYDLSLFFNGVQS